MRGMKTTQKTKKRDVPGNSEAAQARRPNSRAPAQTTNSPKSSRTSAKQDATRPRHTEGKAPARSNGKSDARPDARTRSVASDAVKPRRVGTKMSRLLDSNVVSAKSQAPAPERTAPTRKSYGQPPSLNQWLLYCRPGFEQDCAQEAQRQARSQRPVIAEQPDITPDNGYAVVVLNEQKLDYRELIFARQLIRLQQTISPLPERDRLTPILAAIKALPGNFSALWLEVPDTNDGKTLSAFTRRFQPLLEEALREQGRLQDDDKSLPRLHIFFPDKSSALIGSSDPRNSSSALMGIVRQSMPAEAPSRSTLKLAEAIEVFMGGGEQARLLRQGMTAVDLGAAPGGWTWQMVKRGIRVTAVDNGPMKGVLTNHPLVQHLRQDGFKFAPPKKVDWLICDMVEKPAKVATLIGNWFVAGWCKHAMFNLKLPMKQRLTALDGALGGIRSKLDEEGISYKMICKQLYHDREEVTIFLSKTKG